ncbi:hypothetical protein OUZ56_005390 [Daphnia magna]|uniref:Uncharacterized protein n=1 Tax=Daphnia magna TaxID=35525 RepID=A0ABQ9YSN0_9CRUS|nr:hypothetical protein OUZ56_005390 [Daphnia magna]
MKSAVKTAFTITRHFTIQPGSAIDVCPTKSRRRTPSGLNFYREEDGFSIRAAAAADQLGHK